MTIAILEDNDERISAMQCYLADKFPFFEVRFFRAANEAVEWIREHASQIICLSLDHDLECPAGAPDPGCGRDVAELVAGLQPQFPIVIHSTNVHAAIAMEALLQERGWTVSRVLPYGDLAWLAEIWLPAIRAAIVGSARQPATTACEASPTR
jgi:DNA-binding NarL/FixJ family response regulator